ncbi:MAG: AraC family transcriptional regulator [Reichenbachiella sp.]
MLNTATLKKYLPISDLDKLWGFHINNVGSTDIKKDSVYPPIGHPGSHMFSWEKGRVLDEYQLVLVTEGKGIFESDTAGTIKINAGDGLLIFPGEWHRYKPETKTGWTEYWIGFSGKIPDAIMADFFDKKQPVIKKCATVEAINQLNLIFQFIREEPFGFQRLASANGMKLLALIYNAKQNGSATKSQASWIGEAKNHLHHHINNNIDFQQMAEEIGISYSTFRRDFKHHTGLAPLQYHLLLKIEKAKELLINTDLKVKEIAYQLGFESDFYFCRIFKQKTALSPVQFRTKRSALLVLNDICYKT